MMNERIKAIIDFWFEGATDDVKLGGKDGPAKKWFMKSDAFDRAIKDQFGADVVAAIKGEYTDWETTPEGCLALIILFDQFPRNMYRNQHEMYDTDEKALTLSVQLVDRGHDKKLSLVHRVFVYMPFMHSEELSMQVKGIEAFGYLVKESKEKSSHNTSYFESNLNYAHKHSKVVEEYGRFPHRNEILGRPSTNKELEFLKQPGSGF